MGDRLYNRQVRCHSAHGPCVYGYFYPALLLPSENNYSRAHEIVVQILEYLVFRELFPLSPTSFDLFLFPFVVSLVQVCASGCPDCHRFVRIQISEQSEGRPFKLKLLAWFFETEIPR